MSAPVDQPAFPYQEKDASGKHWHSHEGMTLRDWFAGQVMSGFGGAGEGMLTALNSLAQDDGVTTAEIMARLSYERADAMLLARGDAQ